MERIYLKLFGKHDGYKKYLEYLKTHTDNTDLIQRDLLDKIFANPDNRLFLYLLVNEDTYHLNSETIDRIFSYFNQKHFNDDILTCLINLLGEHYYYENYGEQIKNIIRYNCKYNLDTKLFKKSFGSNVDNEEMLYSIEQLINDVRGSVRRNFNEEYTQKIMDDEIVDLFEYFGELDDKKQSKLKKEDYNYLLSHVSKKRIINESHNKWSSLADTFSVLNIADMNEEEYLIYILNDNVYRRPKSENDKVRNSNLSNEIARKVIERCNDKDYKMDYVQVGLIFKLLKGISDENRKELFSVILNSEDRSGIKELLTLDNEFSEYTENELKEDEFDAIIKNIKNRHDDLLAYEILLNQANSGHENLTERQTKKLKNVILKSKDYFLIAYLALLVDNSLIEPIFKSLDNLVGVIIKESDGTLQNIVKEKYDNLKFNYLNNYNSKKMSNKKVKKRIKKFLKKDDKDDKETR